jgi:hypothetical protein
MAHKTIVLHTHFHTEGQLKIGVLGTVFHS